MSTISTVSSNVISSSRASELQAQANRTNKPVFDAEATAKLAEQEIKNFTASHGIKVDSDAMSKALSQSAARMQAAIDKGLSPADAAKGAAIRIYDDGKIVGPDDAAAQEPASGYQFTAPPTGENLKELVLKSLDNLQETLKKQGIKVNEQSLKDALNKLSESFDSNGKPTQGIRIDDDGKVDVINLNQSVFGGTGTSGTNLNTYA